MARTETVLTVFVASPGDVSEERALLEDVVRELNVIWARDTGIRLDLIRWETHVHPDVGIDAQDVVNRQIPEDYDIFIGILWKRFGTPTGRANSGTEEEFERAFKRHGTDPRNVKIMFYFKDRAVPPSEMDPVQLTRIHEFKERLQNRGVLTGTFTDRDEFASLLRIHLSRQVQSWKTEHGTESRVVPTDQAESIQAETSPDAEGDVGLIDLNELSEESFAQANQALMRISAEIGLLTEQVQQRTDELSRAYTPIGEPDMRAAKRIGDRVGEEFTRFADRLSVEIPQFSESSRTAFDAMSRAATLSIDFDRRAEEDLREALATIQPLKEHIGRSEASTRQFRDTIARLPRITTRFNQGRRHAISTLDRLINEIHSAHSLASQVEVALSNAIEEIRRRGDEGE